MARVCATETWVCHQDWNTSTIFFTIHHIAKVVAAAAGEEITSKTFTIGGSQFFISAIPSTAKVKIFVFNDNSHKVVVDIAVTIRDERTFVPNMREWMDNKELKQNSSVAMDFIPSKEIESLKVVLDLKLRREEVTGLDRGIGGFGRKVAKLEEEVASMKEELRSEMAKSRTSIAIPECPICFEELRAPRRVVTCGRGHKVCKECSGRPEVVAAGCPDNCGAAMVGRDHGMEDLIARIVAQVTP